jgi:hypothetical protein
MTHLVFLALQLASLSPFYNQPGIRHFVFPFGQLNFQDVLSFASAELLVLIILWVIFSFVLIKRSEE